jgi:hypothetical protein
MVTLGALALVLLAAAVLWWRVEPSVRAVLEARADAARAEAEARRAAALAAAAPAVTPVCSAEAPREHIAGTAPPPPAPKPVADPMPPLLASLAEGESEPWAREDVLAAFDETYQEYGRDWHAVTALAHGARGVSPRPREGTP